MSSEGGPEKEQGTGAASPQKPVAANGNVLINGRTSVHAGSLGVLLSVDVCLTKVGKPVVPIPYPNVALSIDAEGTASSVLVNGHPVCHLLSSFGKSMGDEPGNRKGIVSGTIQGKANFVTASANVFIEGVPAVRQGDLMVSNSGNTPPVPLMQPGGAPAPPGALEGADGLEGEEPPETLQWEMGGGELHQMSARVEGENAGDEEGA